jgi:hypothetical protein
VPGLSRGSTLEKCRGVPREIDLIAARIDGAEDRRQAAEYLLWAVLKTKEFLLRR